MHARSQNGPVVHKTLQETQTTFLQHLLQHSLQTPSDLNAEPGLSRGARYSIYKNAYAARLRSALRGDHPTVALALKNDFDELADEYARQFPSTYDSLRWFGNDFPRFLSTSSCPHASALSAMASFERTMLAAFDAGDAPRRASADLENRAQRGDPLGRIELHPSVHVVRPGWNVVPQWHASKKSHALGDWKRDPTPWLVWRGADRLTSFRGSSAPEALLLEGTLEGRSLAENCKQLTQLLSPQAAVAATADTLRRWIKEGLVSRLL